MKIITLKHGQECKVSDEDYPMLSGFKWSLNGAGYACSGRGFIHRIIMNAPKGIEVDHINGDRLDNRRENLRLCTRGQNVSNGRMRGNKTGFKGVYWNAEIRRYYSQITVDKKVICLGYSDSPEEAAHIYDVAAIKYHREFAKTNMELRNGT